MGGGSEFGEVRLLVTCISSLKLGDTDHEDHEAEGNADYDTVSDSLRQDCCPGHFGERNPEMGEGAVRVESDGEGCCEVCRDSTSMLGDEEIRRVEVRELTRILGRSFPAVSVLPACR
jgi:hypothetical protein